MSRTIVAVNAHPDDEALLMSGTLAAAAAAGDRVVLAVATDGALGEADAAHTSDGRLGERRLAELQASADAIGAARVVHLGYADSGMEGELYPDPPGATRFLRADPVEATARVSALLREENADLVIGYDANGGYGHRDHVRVHEITRAAAAETGTRLLEATVPRDLLCKAIDLAAHVYRFPPEFDRGAFDRAYSSASEITHRISVRRQIRAKKASMRAHVSQATASGGGDRTLALFCRIPRPLYDLVFGREWFVDPARPGLRATDIWAVR